MDNNLQPVLLNAQEAYMQSTTNKYKIARKRLRGVIISINKAIENGKYEIEIEKNKLTPVDIEYLEYHGYKYVNTGNFFNLITWKQDETEEVNQTYSD